MKINNLNFAVSLILLTSLFFTTVYANDDFKAISLNHKITQVQPMTGIAYWAGSGNKDAPIQMEFSHIYYDAIISEEGKYNWNSIDKLLEEIKGRNHQAILRFTDISGNSEKTSVPSYIKKKQPPIYTEKKKTVDGKKIYLSDWSHPELKRFILEFFKEFAARYDGDERIAFVEAGFGIWAEYHLTPNTPDLGVNFPDIEFQKNFVNHLNINFKKTRWLISIDAAKNWTPFALESEKDLLKIPFGIFDDSFLQKNYANEKNQWWRVFGAARWETTPIGGEFSDDSYNRKELYSGQVHEKTLKELAKEYGVSFIIARSTTYCDRNKHEETDCKEKGDKDKYKDGVFNYSDIGDAGKNLGYRFKITKFEANSNKSKVTVQNIGIAPIYYDAFVTVNGVRSPISLKGLLPTDKPKEFEIESGGNTPQLTIEADRLYKAEVLASGQKIGQKIEFDADLK